MKRTTKCVRSGLDILGVEQCAAVALAMGAIEQELGYAWITFVTYAKTDVEEGDYTSYFLRRGNIWANSDDATVLTWHILTVVSFFSGSGFRDVGEIPPERLLL